MNQVLTQLLNRRSVRDFTGEEVRLEDLEVILQAAQRSPNSMGGQQISLVYTRDKQRLAAISELCGGREHIEKAGAFVVFVIDFNRTGHAFDSADQQVIPASTEGVLVGAIDAGIMLATLQTAAESLGYASTAIGGMRRDPEGFIKLLGLPKYTFPVVGSTIGVPTAAAKAVPLKPRVPFDSFAFDGTYDDDRVRAGVEVHDRELRDYWDLIGFDSNSYKATMAEIYAKVYMPKVAETMRRQGFASTDE